MVRALVSAILHPRVSELQELLETRWRELPARLRTANQMVGRHVVHCAFTEGASYCALACSHCYLPEEANRIPPPAFGEMADQLRATRAQIGPGGGVQITGGDVIDAYRRAGRTDELIRIVGLAEELGLRPMIMTHGQALLEHPGLLEELVRRGGLGRICFHVDTTQTGRPWPSPDRPRSEAELNPLRDRFVDLVLEVRRRTRRPLLAAHTATVTADNLATIGEVLAWLRADPRRADVFRTMTFLPEARVGRTRPSGGRVSCEQLWSRFAMTLGVELPEEGLRYGHPACSRMTTLAVLFPKGKVLNLVHGDPIFVAVLDEVLDLLSAARDLGGRGSDGGVRKAGLLARRPLLVARALRVAGSRLRSQGVSGRAFLGALASGRVRAFNLLIHSFMDAHELAGRRSAEVEERLAACAFRGALEIDGGWRAIPMCELNAGLHDRLLEARRPPSGSGR